MHHHPVERGCFCDHCIETFNKEYSHAFSREELIFAVNRGDISVRKEWIQFIRDGLYHFTYEIAKAAVRISPDVRFGLQYGPNRRYTGYGYDFLFDAMRDASGKGSVSGREAERLTTTIPSILSKKPGYWSGK